LLSLNSSALNVNMFFARVTYVVSTLFKLFPCSWKLDPRNFSNLIQRGVRGWWQVPLATTFQLSHALHLFISLVFFFFYYRSIWSFRLIRFLEYCTKRFLTIKNKWVYINAWIHKDPVSYVHQSITMSQHVHHKGENHRVWLKSTR
jgi:hypothetical protein